MTEAVQDVVNRFDRLPDADKRAAVAEILRRVRTIDCDGRRDEELVAAAESAFSELDRSEADPHGSGSVPDTERGVLPEWCNVYEGLSEDEIAEIETAIRRADLSRSTE